MTDKTHTFNWQEEGQNSFLKWMLVTMVSGREDDELVEQLSEATDHFTNVELKILVSGVEVNAQKFMDRVKENMDHAVEFEAQKMIGEMPRLNELYDTLHDFERVFKREVFKACREAGFEMRDDDW